MFVCVCVSAHVAFSSQLAEVDSCLPLCVPGDRTQVIRLGVKLLYPLKHLAGLAGLVQSFFDPALS